MSNNHPAFSKQSIDQTELILPILSSNPEIGHTTDQVLSLNNFLTLLREEENYYPGEQEKSNLMITRLRKIFYDKWGWDTALIRGAASIEGRYNVEIIDSSSNNLVDNKMLQSVPLYDDTNYSSSKYRRVTYKPDDRIYGNTRVNQVPEIYQYDHQDVYLPEGHHCDLGHVLAGIDALNYPQVVTPLYLNDNIPPSFQVLYPLFPHVKSNFDVVTWLGDIATISSEFVFTYIRNGLVHLNPAVEQRIIDEYASASDMLGDIDSCAIYYLLKANKFNSKKVSDILNEYYSDTTTGKALRSERFKIFAKHIGLGELRNGRFSNETAWIIEYADQLRSTISFMIYHFTNAPLEQFGLPYLVWKRNYEGVIKINLMLNIFLKALKRVM